MADVWISRKRWTCKYCDVTINDDLPSRRHHETGVRHKQNVQKALQDLYRKGEQERKDAEHTRKEMERIEALAAESYAKDQAAAASTSSAPSTSSQANILASVPTATTSHTKPSSAPPRRPAKSTDEPAQQSSQPEAQAGEWEQVETIQPQLHTSSASSTFHTETSDRDKARSFRMKEKVARLDDSDDDDALDLIKSKKRSRRNEPAELQRDEARGSVPGKVEAETPLSPQVKKEDGESVESASPKKEESSGAESGSAGLFKKRKAGAGAGAKRVRAVI